MRKIYLNKLLEEVIENNNKVKDMFYYLEDNYESNLSFNDLQLWYLDIIEIDLSNYLYDNNLNIFKIDLTNWFYNYLANELLEVVA